MARFCIRSRREAVGTGRELIYRSLICRREDPWSWSNSVFIALLMMNISPKCENELSWSPRLGDFLFFCTEAEGTQRLVIGGGSFGDGSRYPTVLVANWWLR